MADVNHSVSFEKVVGSVTAVDARLRSALTTSIAGISVRDNHLEVHFLSAPGAPDNLATQIVNAHNTLLVTVDQSVIAADGLDIATITCADPVILGDTSIEFTAWLDDAPYTTPSIAPVSGGVAELTLTTEDAGIYLIEIKRTGAGDYQTGYITIQAQEAR
jgi:hypothetical protein